MGKPSKGKRPSGLAPPPHDKAGQEAVAATSKTPGLAAPPHDPEQDVTVPLVSAAPQGQVLSQVQMASFRPALAAPPADPSYQPMQVVSMSSPAAAPYAYQAAPLAAT